MNFHKSSILLCALLTGVLAISQNLKKTDLVYTDEIKNFNLDGDLKEWEGLPKFSIGESGKDFTAFFQSAYQHKSLMIAIQIEDDSNVIDENGNWYNQDAITLYLDEKHDLKGSGVAMFSFNEIFMFMKDPKSSWDPSLSKTASWEDISYKIKKEGTTKTIECVIELDKPVNNNRAIGFDLMINDMDEDGSVSEYSWIPGGGKSSYAGRLGTIVLPDTSKLYDVTGNIKWKDTSVTAKLEKIKVIALNSNFWITKSVDSLGQFQFKIPEGEYKIVPGQKIYFPWPNFYKTIVTANRIDVDKDLKNIDLRLDYEKEPEVQVSEGVLRNYKPSDSTKIDSFISNLMDFYEVPGVSFAAIKDGKILYSQAYGMQNSFTGEKVSEETFFEAASISKPVFAMLVVKLWEDGVIDLDRPLYQYLEFEEVADDERYKLITARHVLSHQTGFPNWGYENPDGKLDIKFEPGTEFGYSGAGYEYLKRVVEEITGKKVAVLFEEKLFKPLGVEGLYFEENDKIVGNKSVGHYNGLPSQVRYPQEAGVAWSLHANAEDFARFMIKIRNRELLSEESYNLLFSEQIEVPENYIENNHGFSEHMGMGFFIEKTPYGKTIRHSGSNWAYKSMFRIYEGLDVGYIMLVNGDTGSALLNAMDNFLVDPSNIESF